MYGTQARAVIEICLAPFLDRTVKRFRSNECIYRIKLKYLSVSCQITSSLNFLITYWCFYIWEITRKAFVIPGPLVIVIKCFHLTVILLFTGHELACSFDLWERGDYSCVTTILKKVASLSPNLFTAEMPPNEMTWWIFPKPWALRWLKQ